jgi:hypothetical protein
VVIGNNFNISGEGVAVQINATAIAQSCIQVHSRTCLVVTVPDMPHFPTGPAMLSVSNDDGANFGAGADFVFGMLCNDDSTLLFFFPLSVFRVLILNSSFPLCLLRFISRMIDSYSLSHSLEPLRGTSHSDATNGLSGSKDAFNTEKREIRIFLSSPFRDMQLERDWFVKWVAPKLKKLCAERSVALTFVDLRWGVTGMHLVRPFIFLCFNFF